MMQRFGGGRFKRFIGCCCWGMADEETTKVLGNVGGKHEEPDGEFMRTVGQRAVQQSDILDIDTKLQSTMGLESSATDQNECSNSVPVPSLETLPQTNRAHAHTRGCDGNRNVTFEIKCGGPLLEIGSENDKENCNISELAVEHTSAEDNSESQKKMEYLRNLSVADLVCCNNVANGAESVVRTHGVLDDGEVVQRAREEGCIVVVFPGSVTQDTCCKFVCEILKCVLYLRQQLPMTYDQLMYYKKDQASNQAEGTVARTVCGPGGWDWRRCQRTLQEVEEVLRQLENLFSVSWVPRVLLLLGGSVMLPKELYEVDMEGLATGAFQQSLLAAPCLRQLFRTLFMADVLCDARPVRLVATTVMALGHRDCGVGWFRPRLDYRVPTRVKRHVISLSSDPALSGLPLSMPGDLEDYVWFQAPVTIKGFCK